MTRAAHSAGEETVAALLADARARFAERTAYIEGDVATSLAAHLDEAAKFASGLAARGIGPGDRVAVLAGNSRPYVALWHAALMGYFTLVPLNWRLSPPELRHVLDNAEPHILIHDDQFAGLAGEAAGASAGAGGIATASLTDLLDDASAELPELPAVAGEDVAVVMYTSGTVGLPKGVEMTQRGLFFFYASANFVWDIESAGTVMYIATPLFHISALWAVLGAALHGNVAVIVPSFDMARMIADSRRYRVTHASVIPTMLPQFLDHPDFRPEDHQHIRYFQYGGAPINPPVIGRFRYALPNLSLVQCYGMTEAVAPLTCLTADAHARGGEALRSCGRALPYADVRIRPLTDADGAAGDVGEIEARSPALFARYRDNPDSTDAALVDGWYRTGDLGRLDEAGFLYVVDRIKDMIITGGENVYSQEVERAIAALDGVAQVAVIGVPSEKWGEEVHAVVVPRPGATLVPETMLRTLRTRLAGYKCPKGFTISAESLPLSGASKVNKRLLKQRHRDGVAPAGAADARASSRAETRDRIGGDHGL